MLFSFNKPRKALQCPVPREYRWPVSITSSIAVWSSAMSISAKKISILFCQHYAKPVAHSASRCMPMHSSARYFLNGHPDVVECIRASVMLKDFATTEEQRAFFQSGIDERVLDEMQKASKPVAMNDKPKNNDLGRLKKLFNKRDTKPQRNVKILEAYQAGISQHKIAAFLQRSQPTVNAIIKREKAKGSSTITIT